MSEKDVPARARWRRTAAALMIGAAVGLSACTASATAEDTPPSEPTESATDAAPVERPDVPGPPEELTFEAGADLDPDVWLAGWHMEPIDMTNGYPVVYPRDDWEEKHLVDDCEGSRYQRFSLDGLDLTLDDRTLTDQYLAELLEIPVDDISQEGSTVAFPVVGRWPMTADLRVRAGDWSNGGTWLTAARVFGALEVAIVVELTCEPGPMTGASGQQMMEHLPTVIEPESLNVGLGRVDWNVVESLDFDDGAELVASSQASWVDAELMEDPSWTFDDAELDDGSWSFTSADGDCTADYQQSLLDEQSASLGDREATDELIALWADDPESFQPEDAVDSQFALGVPGNDLLAMRLLDGDGWVTAARAMTGPRFGFALSVTCSEGDPMDAMKLLMEKSAVQVVP